MKKLKHQQLSLPTVEVFLKIEEQIMLNAAKRLRTKKDLMDGDINSWQMDKMQQLGALNNENIKDLAKHSHLAIDEVAKLLEEAGYSAVGEIEGDLAEAARRGILVRPSDVENSRTLIDILNAYESHSREWINLVNTTMLNKSREEYLKIINDVSGKVSAGVSTPQQALREAARQWADKGTPALIDRAGKRWSTEAYVNMVTRSVARNVADEMQDARMDEYDLDLIEVSSHSGARPGCAPYQGRIYSRRGKTPGYPDLGTTSYGEPAGLFGINCGHFRYPYIPGITERRYRPYDSKENDRIYKESQHQRKIERDIRKAKREYNMMERLGDSEGAEQAKQKVLQKQADMRQYLKDTERTRRRDREQLPVGNPNIRGRVAR